MLVKHNLTSRYDRTVVSTRFFGDSGHVEVKPMTLAVLTMPEPRIEQRKKRERGEGMLLLRGKVWHIQFYVQGRAVRESAKTQVKQVAKELLRRRIIEAQDGNVSDGRLRYEAMRDYLYADYETNKRKSMLTHKDGTRYIGPVPALDAFFKDYKASEITTEVMKRFIRKRQEEEIGNGGINGSIAMLSTMFSLQVKERRFPRNLVPHFPFLEKPKRRRDFLTPDQHATLLKHLPDDIKPLQIVAYDTGARKGELLKLTWNDVDLDSGTVTFHDTKNGEDRSVPLGQHGIKTLRALHATKKSERVFTRNGRPIKNFNRAWVKALNASGLEGKHLFHGNRRSQAVNLMAAGVDKQTAMELTGHKDGQTFDGYRVLVEEAKRAAIAKRDAAMNGDSSVTAAPPRKSKRR